MSTSKVKEEKQKEEAPCPTFSGQKKTKKNLTVTGDLRKKFQESNKTEQKLQIIV